MVKRASYKTVEKVKKLRKKGWKYAKIGKKFNKSSFWAFSLDNREYRPRKYRRKRR